jgi:multiple sugar transport system permease protein
MIAIKPARFTRRERSNLLKGIAFISPWIVGFLVFVLYPILYSFFISLTRYSGLRTPVWVGFQNYSRLFSDPLTWTSVYNTLYYTILAVPVGIVVAILLALAMNRAVKEVAIYRAALYLPSVIPLFAMSFIFIVLVNPQYGLLNSFLGLFGVPATNYLGDPTSAKNVIVGSPR